ncbi:GumC family protein [Pengzhenrongella sicca]|uniref:Polysaccharide chain length determinant N-terminal domain-containing protein n=1 Tax=Pengzhenrongella sicca TaxID=2819238 RepID=A0A8A4ZI19_9MICO|nr:Wzz/FepE/Etk N-terminal domain-containing protein [Pengzhenrongella sicca]QTE29268.1 hypothetical protein J4E96_18650 [Pengzhenrongella sicca]
MGSVTSVLGRHWRLVTVAAIGAILAFAGSYLVETTYSSSTRVLIRGRDATFLTSTGQDLSGQPGVVDSTLAQSLASTYAGIATSRSVAEAVVADLKLDDQPPKTGVLASAAKALAWVYRCGRAFVTSGFCARVDEHEKAVLGVQEGTAVEPLGANAGSSAGTTGSYVLEVRASGSTSTQAQAVTDAVADELIRASAERFQADSAENIASLQGLVASAEADVATRSGALAAFQTQHGILAADGRQTLSATTNEAVRSDLIQAQAQEADLRAQLASIDRALSTTPKNQTSSQRITTGRSTTELAGEDTNAVYTDLQIQQRTLQAQLQGQSARVAQLQATLDGAGTLADNAVAGELADLENAVSLAEQNLAAVTTTLQDAQVTQAQGPVDLTRLDQAGAPAYPSEPKRYIYLALGLLIGGLAGAGLTAQARRREPGVAPDEDDDEAAGARPRGGSGEGEASDAELESSIFGGSLQPTNGRRALHSDPPGRT